MKHWLGKKFVLLFWNNLCINAIYWNHGAMELETHKNMGPQHCQFLEQKKMYAIKCQEASVMAPGHTSAINIG